MADLQDHQEESSQSCQVVQGQRHPPNLHCLHLHFHFPITAPSESSSEKKSNRSIYFLLAFVSLEFFK